MPAPARLIITADDFGISSRVNEAIHRAFESGLVQQASLIVTGAAVEEAARIARRFPALAVGLHLTLCAGRGVRISRLTDRSGRLGRSPVWTGLRYAWPSPGISEVLRAEIDAQFSAFRQLGLGTNHSDGHCHLHLHPNVFPFAAECAGGEFAYVRLLRTPRPRGFLERVFNGLSRQAVRRLGQGPPVRWADATYGLRHTGRMNTASFLACAGAVQPGQLAEIYYHPGAEAGVINPGPILDTIRQRGIVLCAGRECIAR